MQTPPQHPLQPHSQPGIPTEGVHAWAPPRRNLGVNEVFGVLSYTTTQKKALSLQEGCSLGEKQKVRLSVRPPWALHPHSRRGPVWVPAFPRTASIPFLGSGGGVPVVLQAGHPPTPIPKMGGEQAEPAHHPPPICTHIPLCLHHLTPHASLHPIGRTGRFFLPPPSLPAPWISIFPIFFFFLSLLWRVFAISELAGRIPVASAAGSDAASPGTTAIPPASSVLPARISPAGALCPALPSLLLPCRSTGIPRPGKGLTGTVTPERPPNPGGIGATSRWHR